MKSSDTTTDEQLSSLVALLKGLKESDKDMSELMDTTYKLFGGFDGEVFNPYNKLSEVVLDFLVSSGFDKDEISWWLYEKVDKVYYYNGDRYDCSCPVNFTKLSLGIIKTRDLPLIDEDIADE